MASNVLDKVEQARVMALKAAANSDVPTDKCKDEAELQAVILFPALGTPYIAPVSEKTIKVYLIAESKCTSLFDISGTGQGKTAPLAWHFINKHMRLLPFKEAHKTSTDLKGTTLYGSKGAAKAGIKVWYRGTYSDGAGSAGSHWGRELYDHQGRLVAHLRQSAVDFFVKGTAAYGPISPAHPLPPAKADVGNHPLEHLFEIELSLQGLNVAPQPDKAYTLAWMVTNVYRQATTGNGQPAFKGVTEWEHQDKLIYDFLWMMKEKKQHFWEPFTFDVPAITQNRLSQQLRQESSRLKAYHPVMFKQKPALHIGHLTDVHISSRHFALANSEAQAIPGISDKLGPKVTNSFAVLKELFDAMRSKGADAIFVTGDLVDFNQNFNPLELKQGAPKDQWAQYDLSKQFQGTKAKKGTPYVRGLDDMLAYSLFKYSYLNDCPVFVTTGNHEAYDVPYGIAPRLNSYAVGQTIRQTLGEEERRARIQQLRAEAQRCEQQGNASKAAELREKARVLESESPVIPSRVSGAVATAEDAATSVNENRDWDLKSLIPGVQATRDILGLGADKWESMKNPKRGEDDPVDLPYQFSDSRANEGIPADHNLTIYEACMAYGPSYGQLLKSWNFTPANFDWFFMLFTPLADYFVRYGQSQCVIGLDWGETEIMVNADMTAGEVAAAGSEADYEVNGDGSVIPRAVYDPIGALASTAAKTIKATIDQFQGLPRADKSISKVQRSLIQSALRDSGNQCKNLLFSHFTILNYEGSVNYEGRREFVLKDGTFNQFNRGTFSLQRRWLFGLFNDGDASGRLHYTMSGHSHRAGAYSMSWIGGERRSISVRAYEPVEPGDGSYDDVHESMFPYGKTRILVSSCGGPIGTQSYQGELHGWNLTPPSGTLLKTDATGCDEFRRITAKQPSAQPRFCVALDYLTVERGKPVITWKPDPTLLTPGKFFMTVGYVMMAEPFIEKVEFFVWQGDQRRAGGRDSGKYTAFSTTLSLVSEKGKGGKFDEPKIVYQMQIDAPSAMAKAIVASQETPILCRVSFNGALKTNSMYSQYNFDDAWTFPVSIGAGSVGLGFIERPKGEFGEVPRFLLLSRMLPHMYMYDIGGKI
jgi:predicted MPP superfamily phosphohydrolase